jgi:NADH-quinone oxidoreductase subunit E
MQPFEKRDENPQERIPCRLERIGGPIVWSADEKKRIAWLFTRYPTRRAAILPLLWMTQEKLGWIPEEAVVEIAKLAEVPVSHVYGVVSFYTMYNRAPVGRHHIQVCVNLSCQLRGAEHTLACLRDRLGIGLGETTPDGLFTLNEVECLAACEMAPVVQVNEEFIGPLDESGIDPLLAKLTDEAGGRR